MNKTAIRNFAVWARNKLIADVSYRAGLMGVTADGIADALPQSTDNMQFFDIGMAQPYSISGEEIKQRKGLVEVIKKKTADSDYKTAYNSVIEEVAYTWFNRMIAIRFMEVNDYLPSHVRVLSSESGKLEPDLVTTPFDADLFFAPGEQEHVLQLKNDNKLDEVFRLLFIKECNVLYPLLPRLFENLSDYTELLLNVSFIDQDGVVYHLIHDIPEEDFNVELGGQVEIIGWLYQYYNAELKDETFALLKQNVKVTKERVPSATQLFTPDWIVRYMVENSLGRLWLEGHPNDSLKTGWKYYLDEAEQEPEVQDQLDEIRKEYASLNPEDIKVIDPCMGSGHILVYAFDVLMQIYESAGYTERDAAKSILENNIYGLDIDDRAAQLAYFAVMMKARQYNRRILNGESNCHVMAIQESNGLDGSYLRRLGDLQSVGEKLVDAFIDAKEYGSILNVDITLEELDALETRLDELDKMADFGNLIDQYETYILVNALSVLSKQTKNMVQKYDAVITNPPYMGAGNMESKLSQYANKFYPNTKSDLSTICMEQGLSLCKNNGLVSMINIPVWMFLTSYEKFRNNLIKDHTFVNMVHPGRGVFGSDFGSVSFVIWKAKIHDYKAVYARLFEQSVEVKTNEIREQAFLEGKGRFVAKQDGFSKIPGVPIAYWVGDNFINAFSNSPRMNSFGKPVEGIKTGDNEKYLRLWFEPAKASVKLVDDGDYNYHWMPMTKGGAFRKWYGNLDYVVAWGIEGQILKNAAGSSLSNSSLFFSPGLTWTYVTSGQFSMRMVEDYILHNNKGPACYVCSDSKYFLLALMNSVVVAYMLTFLAPTIDCKPGNIANIPVIYEENYKDRIDELSQQCHCISKADWDCCETSWEFKKNPLI